MFSTSRFKDGVLDGWHEWSKVGALEGQRSLVDKYQSTLGFCPRF